MIVFVRILITVLFSLISVISFAETLSRDDLVERDDLLYKKFTNTPFTGKIEEYWENGQLRIIGVIKNGEKKGEWFEYHKDGNLQAKDIFKDKLNFEWYMYNDTGEIYLHQKVINGYYHRVWYNQCNQITSNTRGIITLKGGVIAHGLNDAYHLTENCNPDEPLKLKWRIEYQNNRLVSCEGECKNVKIFPINP